MAHGRILTPPPRANQAAPDATQLLWLTQNPDNLTCDCRYVICPDADVVILAGIEAGLARPITAEHNKMLALRAAFAQSEEVGA